MTSGARTIIYPTKDLAAATNTFRALFGAEPVVEMPYYVQFSDAGQDIGRPFVAPPDLPPERLKMLRDAFNATMKDAEFAADVKRNRFDLEPEDGEHLAALVARIYATPKPVIDRVSNLIK